MNNPEIITQFTQRLNQKIAEFESGIANQAQTAVLLEQWGAICQWCEDFSTLFRESSVWQQQLSSLLQQSINILITRNNGKEALSLLKLFNHLSPSISSLHILEKLLRYFQSKNTSIEILRECYEEIIRLPIDPGRWDIHANALLGFIHLIIDKIKQCLLQNEESELSREQLLEIEGLLIGCAWHISAIKQLCQQRQQSENFELLLELSVQKMTWLFFYTQLRNNIFFSLIYRAKAYRQDLQPWLDRLEMICDGAWALGDNQLSRAILKQVELLLRNSDIKSGGTAINDEAVLNFITRQEHIKNGELSVEFPNNHSINSKWNQFSGKIRQPFNHLSELITYEDFRKRQKQLDQYQTDLKVWLSERMRFVSEQLGNLPTQYAVFLLGSLATELASTHSDLEFMIVVAGHDKVEKKDQDYLKQWSLWLELETILLGETPYQNMQTRVSSGTWPFVGHEALHPTVQALTRAGWRFDEGGNIPARGYLNTPFNLLSDLAKPEEWTNRDGSIKAMLLSTARYFTGNREVADSFLERRRQILSESPDLTQNQSLARLLALNLANGNLNDPINLESARTVDIKSHFIRPVSLSIHTMSLYASLPAASTNQRLDLLVEQKYIHPLLAELIKNYLIFMMSLRINAHHFYGEEKEEISWEEDQINLYKVSTVQRQQIVHWHENLLRPLTEDFELFFKSDSPLLNIDRYQTAIKIWMPELTRDILEELTDDINPKIQNVMHRDFLKPMMRYLRSQKNSLLRKKQNLSLIEQSNILQRFYLGLIHENPVRFSPPLAETKVILDFFLQFITAWQLKLISLGVEFCLPEGWDAFVQEINTDLSWDQPEYDSLFLLTGINGLNKVAYLLRRLGGVYQQTTSASSIRALQDYYLINPAILEEKLSVLFNKLPIELEEIKTAYQQLTQAFFDPVPLDSQFQYVLPLYGVLSPLLLIFILTKDIAFDLIKSTLEDQLISYCQSDKSKKLSGLAIHCLVHYLCYKNVNIEIFVNTYNALPHSLHPLFCQTTIVLFEKLWPDKIAELVEQLGVQALDPDGWSPVLWYEEHEWIRGLKNLVSTESIQDRNDIIITLPDLDCPESMQPRNYSLKPEITAQLFSNKAGFIFNPKPDGQKGNHIVLPITFGGKRYWLKLYPEQPAIEWMIHRLTHYITAGGTPHNVIVKLSNLSGKVAAGQLLEHVEGVDLAIVLKQEPETLKGLSFRNFLRPLIRVLLTNPEDDKPDSYFKTPNGNLVSIDNERAYYAPDEERGIFRNRRLLVKSILYCFDEMQKPFDFSDPLLNRLLMLKAPLLTEHWLQELIALHNYLTLLFDWETVEKHLKITTPGPSLLVLAIGEDLITRFIEQLEAMQTTIEIARKEAWPLTGMLLLHLLQPDLARHYERGFAEYPEEGGRSIISRFTTLTRDSYQATREGGMTSTLPSVMAFSKSIRLSTFTPDDAAQIYRSRQLSVVQVYAHARSLMSDHVNSEELAKKLILMDQSGLIEFQKLSYRFRRIVVKSLIDSIPVNASDEQLSYVLNAIVGLPFSELILTRFGTVVSVTTFRQICSSTNHHLIKLDLRGCRQLNEKALSFLKSNCSKLCELSIGSWDDLTKLENLEFPELKRLCIENQPNLVEIKMKAPKLKQLIIRTCPSLRSIQLGCNWINLEHNLNESTAIESIQGIDWLNLAWVIDKARDLSNEQSELNLSGEMIGPERMGSIAYVIRRHPFLFGLNLRGKELSSKSIEMLSVELRQGNFSVLRRLDLSASNLGDKGANIIIRAMVDNSNMRCLKLSQNNITHAVVEGNRQLFIERIYLEELDFSGNQLREGGAIAISKILTRSNRWIYLNLDNNGVGDAGAEALSGAIVVNTSLQILFLAQNQISSRGANHIWESLRRNKTLFEINLQNNFIENDHANSLNRMLVENNSLTKIDLSENSLTAENLAKIVTTAYQNLTLIFLSVQNNPYADGYDWIAPIIQLIMERNTKLKDDSNSPEVLLKNCENKVKEQVKKSRIESYFTAGIFDGLPHYARENVNTSQNSETGSASTFSRS